MKQKLQPDSAYFKLIFFFSLIFLSTNTLKALINISVNTHWHSGNLPPTSLGNDYRTGIFIQSNVELIIDGRSLAMNTGTTIELDLGAHLRLVNNTIITSSSPGTNVTWNGILATGDLLNHFIQEPDTTILDDTTAWQGIINPDETYVGIFNSTISSAYYGVYSDRGAIVRARNSTFSDNGTGVYIKYSINEKCATYFMDCNFLWTKTNSNLVQTNLTGISLENSNNINIGGCTFTNNDVGLHCTDERGTGIKAAGASFNLSKSGNTFCKDALYCFENCYQSGSPTPVSQSNSFTNLSKGIEVTQGPGSSFRWAYVARQSVFQDNFIAISSNSTENSKVYKCTFSGSRSALAYFFNTTCLTSTTMINHIIFTDDLDWEAYDNTFSFTGAYINHIKAPGYTFAQSRIQMNTFTNSNTSTVASNQVNGIYVSNTNAYMEIYCNTFTNMGTDINLVAGGTVIDPLGSNTLPAENVFSSILVGRYRIDNSANPSMNYFYNSTKGTSHRPLFPTSSISVFETGVAPSQERNCSLKCYKFYTTPVKKHNYYDSYFKIYPNPADNQLNLSSEFNLIKSVIIYNSLGQVVYNFSDETNSNLHQIDVSNLNNGIYQLMVLTPFGTTISKKIIITHIK